MTGVVTGGWGFVWAAYLITAFTLIVYSASVFFRERNERARFEREMKRLSEAGS